MKKTLREIADWLKIEQVMNPETLVTGVSINTRTLQQGDLFIPFRGENTNGHQYVMQAFEKGAVAAIWQKDEPNPPANVPLLFVDNAERALQQMARSYRLEHQAKFIGITGSNGKTSTKDLVAGVLQPYFKVQKTAGNFNNELGLPLTILSLDADTEFAVLEMGMSSFGEIEFLTKLAEPHHVIITNIGEAHMQDLGSREGIAKAKFEIIQGLQSGGKLFYDGDEPLLNTLVAQEKELKAVSFGLHKDVDLKAIDIKSTNQSSSFVTEGTINDSFTIPILGDHQVKNTLAAILIAQEFGLQVSQIQQALQNVELTNMRMQLISGQNDLLFIDDAYNAAPSSMKAALQFMQKTDVRKEKWAVLGDMLELGELEQLFHEEMAEWLNPQKITHVLLFGPRMKWLYDQLTPVYPSAQLLWSEADYEPIITRIRERANEDSLILLKGSRGMALENVLKPFLK